MEGEGANCNTNLALAIGDYGRGAGQNQGFNHLQSKSPVKLHVLFPHHAKEEGEDEEEEEEQSKQYVSVSRSRSRSKQLEEEDDVSGRDNTRKKLKLTKEQLTLLEDTFRVHHTLNTTQKEDLADRLNILPRQVEVWFQNRRARTKLKQIEVDYQLLKKCCESLNDENQRLKKELQQLQSAASPGSPFYLQLLKAATLTMCPVCERIAATGAATAATGKSIKSNTGILSLKN
ncbi:homeobox-leucine zipper protein HAT22-like [Canna indica]|uniref:Homeobox-leucine zipper protein HAT22-like n=1 Tax=Canna indica TaxID=4628 RepID=A0AAQ3KR21_9LILI|nr:homeobox-leucine zipper protein HAT22-like [Canna indica]